MKRKKICWRDDCNNEISDLGGYYIGPKICHCSAECSQKTSSDLDLVPIKEAKPIKVWEKTGYAQGELL